MFEIEYLTFQCWARWGSFHKIKLDSMMVRLIAERLSVRLIIVQARRALVGP